MVVCARNDSTTATGAILASAPCNTAMVAAALFLIALRSTNENAGRDVTRSPPLHAHAPPSSIFTSIVTANVAF